MTDASNFVTTAAPDLISVGTQSTVERASSLGLTWNLRPATVVAIIDGPNGNVTATFDADTQPVTCFNIGGESVYIGMRVMGLQIPPAANYILGPLAPYEDWKQVTLLNGWTNHPSGVRMQYRRVFSPANSLQLVGLMVPGTKADGTVVFQLPLGFRPRNLIIAAVAVDVEGAGASPRFDFFANGNVACEGVSASGAVALSLLIPLDAI
jgi:hypothetical protein